MATSQQAASRRRARRARGATAHMWSKFLERRRHCRDACLVESAPRSDCANEALARAARAFHGRAARCVVWGATRHIVFTSSMVDGACLFTRRSCMCSFSTPQHAKFRAKIKRRRASRVLVESHQGLNVCFGALLRGHLLGSYHLSSWFRVGFSHWALVDSSYYYV